MGFVFISGATKRGGDFWNVLDTFHTLCLCNKYILLYIKTLIATQ